MLPYQLLWSPAEERWIPHTKFASDVKMDDTICAPKGYEKAYNSCLMRISGESKQVPKQVQNGLKEQRMETGLGFYRG